MNHLKLGLVILSLVYNGFAARQSQVSQWGITWTFDGEYETGQFANGDWWVAGPVTITRITPDLRVRDYWDFADDTTKGIMLKKINGWQINPTAYAPQGFDETFPDFDSSVIPDLPYLAVPGQSIVKAISDTNYDHGLTRESRGHLFADSRMKRVCALLTAAVLTVVDTIPPDSGKTVLRPPYAGSDKPYYSVNDLRTDLLPSLAPVANAPTLVWIEAGFMRVQMDHKAGGANGWLRAYENMASTYGPTNAVRDVNASLRLLLDDPLGDKMPALTVFTQYGLDLCYAVINGQDWPGGWGIQPGHKMPAAFAALLLDDQYLKDAVSTSSIFAESYTMSSSGKRAVLWGGFYEYTIDQEYSYWNYMMEPPTYNAYATEDPYGYIDCCMNMNLQNDGYQLCCYAHPYKGEALTGFLVPELKTIWNQPEFFHYVDRWVNHGLLTQPDPCAPAEGTWSGGPADGQPCTAAEDTLGDNAQCIVDKSKYMVTYGPDPVRHGDCIRDTDPSDGIGRFPLRDGQLKDGRGGGYESRFVDAMWDAYRTRDPVATPYFSPAGGTFTGVVDVFLVPHPSSYAVEFRYTTDLSDPTGSSLFYDGPIRLWSSTTLKARAYYQGYTPSPVVQGTFTISPDTQGPAISDISTKNDSTKVTVVYSELVDSVTAGLAANYSVDQGVSVLAVSLERNGPQAVLTTTAMTEGITYTLTVNNVKDLSDNSIAANTQRKFTFNNFDPWVGLTGCWPFNDDKGAVAHDMSNYLINNPFNGTVSGAQWVSARVGQGLAFTGPGDTVTLTKQTSFSFGMDQANAFTIACWVMVTGHGTADDMLLGRINRYGISPLAIWVTSDGHIKTGVTRTSYTTSTAVLTDSAWYHVALTYTDSSRVLYINGVKDEGGSNNLVADLSFPNTDYFFLGTGLRGILDEVRFYNRALSANKIACLYADTTLVTAIGHRTALTVGDRVWIGLPNPAYTLELLWRQFPDLKIYDVMGREVKPGVVRKNGIYLLQCQETKELQKVILVK